jgi:hypothetical protein
MKHACTTWCPGCGGSVAKNGDDRTDLAVAVSEPLLRFDDSSALTAVLDSGRAATLKDTMSKGNLVK